MMYIRPTDQTKDRHNSMIDTYTGDVTIPEGERKV